MVGCGQWERATKRGGGTSTYNVLANHASLSSAIRFGSTGENLKGNNQTCLRQDSGAESSGKVGNMWFEFNLSAA